MDGFGIKLPEKVDMPLNIKKTNKPKQYRTETINYKNITPKKINRHPQKCFEEKLWAKVCIRIYIYIYIKRERKRERERERERGREGRGIK